MILVPKATNLATIKCVPSKQTLVLKTARKRDCSCHVGVVLCCLAVKDTT